MMEIPLDDLLWKNRAKLSKRTSPPPLIDPDEDEIAAAEALVLLAISGGGFCVSSAATINNSPNKRQELALLTAAAVNNNNLEQTSPDTPLLLVFHQCFVCGQVFHSSQALGGHMASHSAKTESAAPAASRKVHECSFCHETFATGQALGGHKQKHYDGPVLPRKAAKVTSDSVAGETSPGGGDTGHDRPMFDINLPALPQEENKL